MSQNPNLKSLTRKEAIMMGELDTPKSREEAILLNQEGLKVFTKDEYLRLNNYHRSVQTPTVPDSSEDTDAPV